jgi:hypothetical protein
MYVTLYTVQVQMSASGIITIYDEVTPVTPRNYTVVNWNFVLILREVGHTLAQLVEALRYKPEGRGFES